MKRKMRICLFLIFSEQSVMIWSEEELRSLTWPRRSDETRKTVISSLAIFGRLLLYFFFLYFHFDSIIFQMQREKRERPSRRSGGSCFKCWPCPFLTCGSLSISLALFWSDGGGGGDPPEAKCLLVSRRREKKSSPFNTERMLLTSCLAFLCRFRVTVKKPERKWAIKHTHLVYIIRR